MSTRVDGKLPDGALRETDPEVIEEQERLEGLVSKQEEIEGRIRELRERKQHRDTTDPLDASAEAYLESDTADEGGVAVAPTVDEELDELEEERRVIGRAIDLQRERLRETEREIVQELAEEVRPTQQEIMQQVADRLVEAAELLEEEQEIRERLGQAAPFSSTGSVLTPPPAMPFNQLRLHSGERGRTVLQIALDTLVEDHEIRDPR